MKAVTSKTKKYGRNGRKLFHALWIFTSAESEGIKRLALLQKVKALKDSGKLTFVLCTFYLS